MNASGFLSALIIGLLGLGSCSDDGSSVGREMEATVEFPTDCQARKGQGFTNGKRHIQMPGAGGRDYVLHTACWWQIGDDKYHTAHFNLIEAIGFYKYTIEVDTFPDIERELDRLPFNRAAVQRRVESLVGKEQEITLARVPAADVPPGAEDCWSYRSRYSHQSERTKPGVVFNVRTKGLYCVSWDPEKRVENLVLLDLSEQYSPELGHQLMNDFELIGLQVFQTLRIGHLSNSTDRPLPLEIRFQFEAGRKASTAGDSDQALKHYTHAIELSDATHAAALNNRALIYAARGETTAALDDIDKALEMASDESLYHTNRCLILRLISEHEEALESCERAFTSRMPENEENLAWVYLQRGLVLRMVGKTDAAVGDFVKSLEYAKPSTLSQTQKMMTSTTLYDGPVDGILNRELSDAIGNCVRSNECFEQASKQMSDVVQFLQ